MTGIKVRFWYEDHKNGKKIELELDALDFIGMLIMHIPKKHFKMMRRYGLYRRSLNKLDQQVVNLWNYIKTRDIKKIERYTSKKRHGSKGLLKALAKILSFAFIATKK